MTLLRQIEMFALVGVSNVILTFTENPTLRRPCRPSGCEAKSGFEVLRDT